jgi:hypothetical protein
MDDFGYAGARHLIRIPQGNHAMSGFGQPQG